MAVLANPKLGMVTLSQMAAGLNHAESLAYLVGMKTAFEGMLQVLREYCGARKHFRRYMLEQLAQLQARAADESRRATSELAQASFGATPAEATNVPAFQTWRGFTDAAVTIECVLGKEVMFVGLSHLSQVDGHRPGVAWMLSKLLGELEVLIALQAGQFLQTHELLPDLHRAGLLMRPMFSTRQQAGYAS